MLLYFGLILAFIAESRYIYSIIKGYTKPNFSSWGIFTISMFLVLASSYSLGSNETLFIIGMFTLMHLITTIVAFKYRSFTITTFEKTLLLLVLLSIVLWITTNNPFTALIINVVVDMLGYLLIIYKSHLYHLSEDVVAWSISVISYLINISLIDFWNINEYLFSVSNVFFITAILLLYFYQKITPLKKGQITR